MKPASTFKTALLLWGIASLLVIAAVTGIHLLRGAEGFDAAIQTGPFSSLPVTLSSVAVVWLLAGPLLYLLAAKRINATNVFTIAGFYLVAFVYLNFLRERPDYGDIEYYIQAAAHLYNNQPLPPEFLYPPLWATLLEPLVPLGETAIFVIVWLANLFGLFLFYFLLTATLRRCEFSPRLAALVTTGFLLVNTPLVRTLVYMQVNLHTLNFILLSLLLFRRRPFLSAFFLALAVHLKASPAVIVLAFLLEKDIRWIIYFGISLLLVSIPTLALDGFGPYANFLHNAVLLTAPHEVSFRDNSFDGFFAAIGLFLDLNPLPIKIMVYASKLTLACLTLIGMISAIKRRVFDSKSDSPALFNSLPLLFILMTLSTPVVWEHHGIFLSLSFLLLLKRLDSTPDWLWFGAAYFLEFILPAFDFFPFSYGRLLAPLIILWLTWRASRRAEPSALFINLNKEVST